MFDDMTFENILQEMLNAAPDGIDTREGSIFYDAVAAVALLLASSFAQATVMYNQLHLKTATGEALELKGDERLVERQAATQAEYAFIYEGTAPPLGASFYSESGFYFTLLQYEDGTYYLESVETGTDNNTIEEGTKAIPVETYTDLTSASFGELYVPAEDEEDDSDYRQSIYDSLLPGENGNIQHYKNWCKEVDGVHHARILPLYGGPNTVFAVIIASDGSPASDELLAKVQEQIDPITKNLEVTVNGITYVVGDGLGEGTANIGVHFKALSPAEEEIDIILGGLKIADGYTEDDVTENITEAIGEYFTELSLATDDDSVIVTASAVGAQIQALDCVEYYSTITLTDGLYVISCDALSIPVLGVIEI